MLHTLKITNVALIDELTIEFKDNLNVLTGETGSGKSIIIDSLNFLLGARADKTLIRSGKKEAKVVGVFQLNEANTFVDNFFIENDIKKEDTIIISRQMNVNGKSITKINGEFVTATMLRKLTAYLIDIHGQNEHQFLLNNAHQLQLIDDYGEQKIVNIKADYSKLLKTLNVVNEKLGRFGTSEEERLKQIDLLSYEIDEIEKAALTVEEEQSLIERYKKLTNIEKINEGLKLALESLENGFSGGVARSITNAITSFNAISQYDKQLEVVKDRLNSSKIELEDIIYEISNISESLEFDAEDFTQLDDRLEEIKRLKRKYGGSVESVLEYLEKAKTELDDLVNSKDRFVKLTQEKNNILKNILACGEKLHNCRVEVANKLVKVVLEELKDLGMPNANLQVAFKALPSLSLVEQSITKSGLDNVEFMFSANLGEPTKPLNKIISGGEMSRFMLAIKTIWMKTGELDTMIFDEIDTGVSGKMAQAISRKLAKISKNHQVIVVSHLPQISAMADAHYYIEKNIVNNKTLTTIKALNEEEKLTEIARMLSADKVSQSALTNARQLKEECDKFKLLLK